MSLVPHAFVMLLQIAMRCHNSAIICKAHDTALPLGKLE
jgi:hypothetical protein